MAGLSVFAALLCASAASAQTSLPTESPAASESPALPPAPAPVQAVAVLRATSSGPGVSGSVVFTQGIDGVVATFVVSGLQALSTHGIHIHQYGNIDPNPYNDGSHAGSHYNPRNSPHGCPPAVQRHVGDMGNITADASGNVNTEKIFNNLSLLGTESIVGRAVVLHSQPDDCVTQDNGAAGVRIALGVIGIANAPGNTASHDDPITADANCVLYPTTGNTISGIVLFGRVNNNQTWIYAELTGFRSNSEHGFHIFEFGDIRSPDGSMTGSHFNPYNTSHGIPGNGERIHVGDLGNVVARQDGRVFLNQVFSLSLFSTDKVIGRSLVISEKKDDGSQPNGNTGSRFAQCVIGYVGNDPYGCEDPHAINFDPTARAPDGVCLFSVADISPAGGSISGKYATSTVTMTVAPNALTETLTATVQTPFAPRGPPPDCTGYGDGFKLTLGGEGELYSPKISPIVSVQLSAADREKLKPGQTVHLYEEWEGRLWEQVPDSTYDFATGIASGKIKSFPVYIQIFEGPTSDSDKSSGGLSDDVTLYAVIAGGISGTALLVGVSYYVFVRRKNPRITELDFLQYNRIS